MDQFNSKKYPIYANFLNKLARELTNFYHSKLNRTFKVSNKLKGKGYDPVTTSDKAFEKFIRSKIKSKFPNADILIEDLAGDNNHYSVSIKSSAFNGLNRIQQHQLVYKSLDGLMDNELHAMQLKTKGTE